jgi:hypothetical protein
MVILALPNWKTNWFVLFACEVKKIVCLCLYVRKGPHKKAFPYLGAYIGSNFTNW